MNKWIKCSNRNPDPDIDGLSDQVDDVLIIFKRTCELNFACLACVNKHIEHKKKLLAFVRDVARALDHVDIQPNSAFHKNAKELIKEIEELKK